MSTQHISSSSNSLPTENLILFARICGAWSIRGALKIDIFSNWENINKIKNFYLAKSDNPIDIFQKLSINSVYPQNRAISFSEINNRNDAELLKNYFLFIPRENLPQLKRGEYYHGDLIGKFVENCNGELIGKVITVLSNGVQDILEIEKVEIRIETSITSITSITTTTAIKNNINKKPKKAKSIPTILIPMVKSYIVKIEEKIVVNWQIDW